MTDQLKPVADEFGFVKTLNNQGFMTDYLDEFSQAFVEFSPKAPGPVLDIGAAYGVASLAALRAGANVIANDIDPRHLEILMREAVQKLGEDVTCLKLLPGKFPGELACEESSLGAILACRVFHFFDGDTIEQGIHAAFRWLKPGGKFFLVGETPYVGGLQPFVPIYEARRAEGAKWPGYIEDFLKIDPNRGKDLPKSMHLLDVEVLTRVFQDAGFSIERAHTIARPHFPPGLKLDGRESVGIIGVKQ